MITAHGDIDTAIKAMKSGAYDFINKPFELDEMIMLVQKASEEIKLTGEVEHLRGAYTCRRRRAYSDRSIRCHRECDRAGREGLRYP